MDADRRDLSRRSQDDWDMHFMNMAREIGQHSKDRSRKVGCVIVSPDNEIRTTGFNDFPRGIKSDLDERHMRPAKYKWIEHAERNAIFNAARFGIALDGCRGYLPWFPCMECARGIIQVGIVELVSYAPDLTDPQWGDDFRNVQILFREAGLLNRYFSLRMEVT